MRESELEGLPVFDRAATFDRLDGDESIFKELINIFNEDSRKQIEQLRAAIALSNPTDTYKLAHTLKGALGNIGAMRCHRIALELEKEGKAGKCVPELLTRLEHEISVYLVEIHK